MTLDEWRQRYLISPAAYKDLLAVLASNDRAPEIAQGHDPKSEAYTQSQVRLEAPHHGYWFTRNNVGMLYDKEGTPVRYGLCNETKDQNKVMKSGDLIGFKRRVIVTADVGTVIAQFASRECKKQGWKYTGTPREEAQAAWRDFINMNGGDAAFASGPGSFNKL